MMTHNTPFCKYTAYKIQNYMYPLNEKFNMIGKEQKQKIKTKTNMKGYM